MKDNLATSFARALERFRDQTRGDFSARLVADVLEPMANELEFLSSEIERTQEEISHLETELEGNGP